MLRKWPTSQSVSSANMHIIKRKTKGSLRYSKILSKFPLDRFLIFVLVRRHVTFKVRLLGGVDRPAVPHVAYLVHIATMQFW